MVNFGDHCSFTRLRIVMIVITTVSALVSSDSLALMADEADEEDVRPGLHARLSDSSHAIARIDRRLNFDWTDGSVDSRLGDIFRGTWTGNLLVRSPADHVFHAMISGKTTIVVDDVTVLEATGDNVFRSGNPVALSAGDHRIQVLYERIAGCDAKLQLFWSSPEFTLEPLPADALSHDGTPAVNSAENENHPDASLAESGRFLADALRCSACHEGLNELQTLKAPSLQQVHELPYEHLLARLSSPHAADSGSMMPVFEFSKQEAEQVAAFLRDAAGGKSVVDGNPIKFKPDDADAGNRLMLTTGCVSCHAVPQLARGFEPAANPWHGPDLTDVALRRSGPWLMKWLQAPEAINPDHRMPIFTLSDDERRQIVASLLKQSNDESADASNVGDNRKLANTGPPDSSAIESGRKLVLAANCAGCHRIPGIDAPKSRLSRPSSLAALTSKTNCIAPQHEVRESSEGQRRPRFAISDPQRSQLVAWLTSMNGNLHPAANFTKGEFLIRRSGCLACHDRDQQRGISQLAGTIEKQRDDLRGQSQTLIPPALTAVGDRLRDETLMAAVAGEQTVRRLPWLLVRMPKFKFSPDDRSGIVRYFVGADRIPDDADSARPELFEHLNPHHPSLATASDLLTGNHLTGASGFNCIACHKAGSYEPRNVAMGTRGSDIMLMGQRLRSRYFLRWMQNPIRVMPGIEMPALRKPVAGVLDDSLPRQIAMMWTALADPKFSPPTVVSRYEQFVTVSPGDRPRVIRDVFTIGDSKDRDSVARALAIGFGNGHNVLIDLDAMHLRQWTIGEFARQRTEGKSWFWDMAGVSVLQRSEASSFCRLRNLSSGTTEDLIPVIDERRQAELLSYSVEESRVSLRVRFHFEPRKNPSARSKEEADPSPHSAITAWNDPSREMLQVVVQFTVQATDSSQTESGWMMTATVEECPEEYALLLNQWRPENVIGEISWQAVVDPWRNSGDEVLQLSKGESAALSMITNLVPPVLSPIATPRLRNAADEVTVVPGFRGQRLPIETAIMPTAMTWLADGQLVFTSLHGHVWIAKDTDGDQLGDSLSLFAEGLAAPYGIEVDGDSILVAHKPEVLRLRDSDGDGKADQFDVVASGWGFSDDYHDWTTGLVRGPNGDLFVGLGSDYSQNKRPADNDRWRGTVLKINTAGSITPVAYSFRFPMGLAFDRNHHLFVTDNQGVQNTFNEINHAIAGRHYGVPSRHDSTKVVIAESPALMIPHPWTRSVNSILFLPDDYSVAELAGHGIGCEYDTRCLIRFTIQEVDGTLQGACYRFSLPDQPGGGTNFIGPVSSAIGADGALYIGSIWDSGWQGGSNTGGIERLVPGPKMPNGIREIVATSNGFGVAFFHPVDEAKACDPDNWSLQAYTRRWEGNYATPDSDRHTLNPSALTLSDDGRTVILTAGPLKAGYVYEISVRQSLDDSKTFWPTEGHYSMKVVPERRVE